MRRADRNKEKIESIEREKNRQKRKVKNARLFKFLFVLFLFLSLTFVTLRYLGTSGLVVREYVNKSDKLPKSFYGAKIVHFSDLHYGHTTDLKKLDKLTQKINYIKADLVIFTGDLVDRNSKKVDYDALSKALAKIEAKLGKYMVLGNHDKSDKVAKCLTDAGFIDLNNKFELIYNDDYQSILLSGIGDSILGRDDITAAMAYFLDEAANRDIFSIVIAHEGDAFIDILDNYPVDIALSGHSHNGQVRLPKIGSLVKVRGAKTYSEAFYEVGETNIYVSGGIGTTVLPFRLFNQPSINLIRIK